MRAASDERGTGLISSIAAVTVVLTFVLGAVQVTLDLATTTTVSAAAVDAARRVASHAIDHRDPVVVREAQRAAEAQMREQLGPLGDRVRTSWQLDQEAVHLRIRVAAPRILPPSLPIGRDEVDRTFSVRLEELR